jgi:hypothetical protein
MIENSLAEEQRISRETIHLSSKVSLKARVESRAQSKGFPADLAAADLLRKGMECFREAYSTRNPEDLLLAYRQKSDALEGSEILDWSFRAERKLVIRARLYAKEFEMPTSVFANYMIVEALGRTSD